MITQTPHTLLKMMVKMVPMHCGTMSKDRNAADNLQSGNSPEPQGDIQGESPQSRLSGRKATK